MKRKEAGGRIPCLALWAALPGAGLTAWAGHAWAQFGPSGGFGPAAPTGIFAWLLAEQAFFYRGLAAALHAAKTNGSAVWGLMGISFIYGIFHAAGPGHGKAVISSYLLANEETWRRGVVLSFASAVMQSLTAIAIVAVAALVIGATAKMLDDTVRIIETVSYALIIVIGLRLLWVKGKSFLALLRRMRACESAVAAPERAAADGRAAPHRHDEDACHGHAHPHDHAGHPPDKGLRPADDVRHRSADDRHRDGHDHEHHHGHDHDEEGSVLPWGHAHGPEPGQLAGPGGWRRGLSAIVAVGLRPCSGAIIVLVFALSQGLFWAGVASTFVMGLGTAITVGGIATLAVGAKSVAKRLSVTRPGYGTLAMRGLEVAAAGLILLVGIALLTGYMASERMGLF